MVLQRAERAALACESAAQELEKASVEMDKAAEVTQTSLKQRVFMHGTTPLAVPRLLA